MDLSITDSKRLVKKSASDLFFSEYLSLNPGKMHVLENSVSRYVCAEQEANCEQYSPCYGLIMYPETWLLHSMAQSQWRVII